MQMRNQFGSVAAGIVFGTLVLLGTSASAALTLRLSDGVTTATVVDGTNSGIVTFSGALGAGPWGVNTTTGISKPLLGASGLAEFDLSSINVTTAIPAALTQTLTIELSDDGFLLPALTGFGTFAIGGTAANNITWASYIDPGNTLFAQTDLIGSSSSGNGAFSDTLGSALGLTGPFSMTTVITITHNGRAQVTSFDANTQVAAPEPATLSVLGGGLLALGAFARRLRRRAHVLSS